MEKTDEILKLSNIENGYKRNMDTIKVNDINFFKMNEIADINRYVVLGNQIQTTSLKNIFWSEPFYFYTEYLGS